MASLTPDEILNAKLEKLVPEIQASKYGKYPMCGQQWLQATDTTPDGAPCSIPGPYSGPKTDYAFGGGANGEMYYHLLTRPAYVILCNRVTGEKPFVWSEWICFGIFCGCFSTKLSDYHEVHQILYSRAKSSVPNDQQSIQDVKEKLSQVVNFN
jgi:hypothetical protein